MSRAKKKRIKRLVLPLSLKKKLIGFMLLQSVTISVLVTVFSYSNASISMQRHSVSFSTELLSTKTYQISEYLRRVEQYSQDILYEDGIYTLLDKTVDFDHDDLYAEGDKMAILEENGSPVINLFSKTIMSRVEIQSLALLDNVGEIWVSQDDNSIDFDLASFLDASVFGEMRKTADGDVIPHIFIYEQGGDAQQIFFVRRLSSPDTYKPLGYFVLMVDYGYFKSLLESSEEQQGYSLVLTSEDGIMLYQAGTGIEGVNDYLAKNIVWKVDSENGVLYTRGEVTGTDWTLIAVQDLSVLFKDTIILRNTLLIITAVAVVIFALLSIAMASDILKPVERLIKSMKRVQGGETGVNVKVDRQDELGYMSKTFNDMIRENEMLVRSIYRAEITKKDAELQALQSQINPHFLYNTLESISWSARLAGVDEISEMVEDLAEIMEAGVGKSEEFIPLKTEIEYIETYLRIMKRRFEDRLKTEIDRDPELKDYKVPKLLIQPLIENAIYHGIDKSAKGGFIKLSAKKQNDDVVITVTNSGKPISSREIEELNSHLMMPSDEYFYNLRKHQRNNVGIENVNRRIKLYFGEQYGLKIEKNAEGHTQVTALLPLGGMDEIQSIADR
jgi:two-component system sensor histidine kinase YesM